MPKIESDSAFAARIAAGLDNLAARVAVLPCPVMFRAHDGGLVDIPTLRQWLALYDDPRLDPAGRSLRLDGIGQIAGIWPRLPQEAR